MMDAPGGGDDNDAKAKTNKAVDVWREVPPAARRALREAVARHAHAAKARAPREIGGRGGADPARYGDWEVKGIASDF